MDPETARFFEEVSQEITQLKARVDALEAGYRRVDTRDVGRPAPTPETKEP